MTSSVRGQAAAAAAFVALARRCLEYAAPARPAAAEAVAELQAAARARAGELILQALCVTRCVSITSMFPVNFRKTVLRATRAFFLNFEGAHQGYAKL